MSRHRYSELTCQSLGSYSTDRQLCPQHDQPASGWQGDKIDNCIKCTLLVKKRAKVIFVVTLSIVF